MIVDRRISPEPPRLAGVCFLIGLVSILLSACAGSDGPPIFEGTYVWVAQEFSGGRQCEPREHYPVPDSLAMLEEAGVRVFERTEKRQAVCLGCDCPMYAARHFARIRFHDLEAAEELGFGRAIAPAER